MKARNPIISTKPVIFKNEKILKPAKYATRKGSTSVINKTNHYNEKVREQRLLYYLFDLFDSTSDVNLLIQKIVDALPSSSEFSEEISARVTFNDFEYLTTHFNESLYSLNTSFKTISNKVGKIEVFYKTEPSNRQMGSTLKESHLLLDCIAKMLVSWLNRLETEKELEKMLVQLEMKIENRTEQLKKANQKLIDMNKDINDSINYANRIQRAILPTSSQINQVFNDAFVFYKPKDIISGDFYWLHKTTNKIFYACADCTGHGVPGALMSMVGHQLLDHIIADKKIVEPECILEEMDMAIIKLFKKSQLSDHLRDGMAMSLCVIDLRDKKISFSGAYNNAYMFINNEMTVLEADRQYIGGNEVTGGKKFTKTVKIFCSDDLLYMFTDGLSDQFGESSGKKLMRKNLLDLISKNRNETMELQGEIFEYFFDKWKGNNFQVDDVTLLGVKL